MIRPNLVTKAEAAQIAYRHGGRLLRPREAEELAKKQGVDIDIWLEGETDESGYTPYFSAAKQVRMQKPANEQSLLIYFMDVEKVKKMQEEAMKRAKQQAHLRRMNRLNGRDSRY